MNLGVLLLLYLGLAHSRSCLYRHSKNILFTLCTYLYVPSHFALRIYNIKHLISGTYFVMSLKVSITFARWTLISVPLFVFIRTFTLRWLVSYIYILNLPKMQHFYDDNIPRANYYKTLCKNVFQAAGKPFF